MADKCPCLIPGDDGETCTECGQHISLPDVEVPDLGDIVGIIRLLDATVHSYAQLVTANTDPLDPLRPRLQLIGGMLMRMPHRALYNQIVGPSFRQAKQLGYRGSMERWQELLIEAVEHPQLPPA